MMEDTTRFFEDLDESAVFQFQMPAGATLDTGEKRIAAAVLHQAFCDLDPGKIYSAMAGTSRKRQHSRHLKISREARWWFAHDEPEARWAFTLRDICETLGLDVAMVRERADAFKPGGFLPKRWVGTMHGKICALPHPWTGRTRRVGASKSGLHRPQTRPMAKTEGVPVPAPAEGT